MKTRTGEIAQMALRIVKSLEHLEHHEKSAALACAASMLQAQMQGEAVKAKTSGIFVTDEELEG